MPVLGCSRRAVFNSVEAASVLSPGGPGAVPRPALIPRSSPYPLACRRARAFSILFGRVRRLHQKMVCSSLSTPRSSSTPRTPGMFSAAMRAASF